MQNLLIDAIGELYDGSHYEAVTDILYMSELYQLFKLEKDIEYNKKMYRCILIRKDVYNDNDLIDVIESEIIYFDYKEL